MRGSEGPGAGPGAGRDVRDEHRGERGERRAARRVLAERDARLCEPRAHGCVRCGCREAAARERVHDEVRDDAQCAVPHGAALVPQQRQPRRGAAAREQHAHDALLRRAQRHRSDQPHEVLHQLDAHGRVLARVDAPLHRLGLALVQATVSPTSTGATSVGGVLCGGGGGGEDGDEGEELGADGGGGLRGEGGAARVGTGGAGGLREDVRVARVVREERVEDARDADDAAEELRLVVRVHVRAAQELLLHRARRARPDAEVQVHVAEELRDERAAVRDDGHEAVERLHDGRRPHRRGHVLRQHVSEQRKEAAPGHLLQVQRVLRRQHPHQVQQVHQRIRV